MHQIKNKNKCQNSFRSWITNHEKNYSFWSEIYGKWNETHRVDMPNLGIIQSDNQQVKDVALESTSPRMIRSNRLSMSVTEIPIKTQLPNLEQVQMTQTQNSKWIGWIQANRLANSIWSKLCWMTRLLLVKVENVRKVIFECR